MLQASFQKSTQPSSGSPDRIPNFDALKEAGITKSQNVEEFFKPDLLAFKEKILDSDVSSMTSLSSMGADIILEKRYSMKRYPGDKNTVKQNNEDSEQNDKLWKKRLKVLQLNHRKSKVVRLNSVGKMNDLITKGTEAMAVIKLF